MCCFKLNATLISACVKNILLYVEVSPLCVPLILYLSEDSLWGCNENNEGADFENRRLELKARRHKSSRLQSYPICWFRTRVRETNNGFISGMCLNFLLFPRWNKPFCLRHFCSYFIHWYNIHRFTIFFYKAFTGMNRICKLINLHGSFFEI